MQEKHSAVRRMGTIIVRTLATVALLSTAVAHAGYRLMDERGEHNLVSKGRFKQTSRGNDSIQSMIDVSSGRMWISNGAKKLYWEGTVEEFCGQMKQTVSAMQDAVRKTMEQQMATMPTDQRAKMKAMMKGFGASPPMAGAPPEKEPKTTVEKTGETAMLAGQPTRKYRVLTDGELSGEYWVTTDPGIARELALDRAAATMGRFGNCQASGGGARKMGAMEQVFSHGFPLKTVSYSGGKAVVGQEYTKVEPAEIPDSEFAPPAGFQKAANQQAIFGGLGGEEVPGRRGRATDPHP